MWIPTAFLSGGASLFLVLVLVQSYVAPAVLQRIYQRYALFLLCMLCYFCIQPYQDEMWAKQSEAVLFSGIVIGYLLFIKALFAGRRASSFINDLAQAGIFAVLVCLLVEKAMHVVVMKPGVSSGYIKMVDSLLRGFMGILGLLFIVRIYQRFPEDRHFSSFLLLGNLFLLLGGIVAGGIALVPELGGQASTEVYEWSQHNRLLVMQLALFPEIVCCFLTIVRWQDGPPAPALAPPVEIDSAPTDTDTDTQEAPAQADTAPLPSTQKIALKTAKGVELMKKSDIILIQGGGNGANFIKVFKEGQAQPIIVNQTLSHTLRLLSADSTDFQQSHKSYLINVQKICRLHYDADGVMVAVMDNGQTVPVTPDRLPALKALLGLG